MKHIDVADTHLSLMLTSTLRNVAQNQGDNYEIFGLSGMFRGTEFLPLISVALIDLI